MCGIVSLIYREETPAMGAEASELLKRLEYRGYDSTGASFIDKDKTIVVVKKVGAPSKVTRELKIPSYKGQRFIGQVRWATYGAVTDINCQPHHVRCKHEIVGAHNGNISNTDVLKKSLALRSHNVVSDNDGEIIVHLVEDAYAANRAAPGAVLAGMKAACKAAALSEALPDDVLLMIDAIRKAEAEAEGSYAAAVSDPLVPGVFAIKSGSSLYAGCGSDQNGDFTVVSSDLTSVLTKTRLLIPFSEGEGVWYTENRYVIFSLHGDIRLSVPKLKRSKLNVRDTGLDPRYKYYMEQEIFSAPANIEELARLYFGDPAEDAFAAFFERIAAALETAIDAVGALSSQANDRDFAKAYAAITGTPVFAAWLASFKEYPSAAILLAGKKTGDYRSDEAQLLTELARVCPDRREELAFLDIASLWRKRREVLQKCGMFTDLVNKTRSTRGTIYIIASGTSYHAALIASYFFGGMARMPVFPCNPGMFRSAYMNALSDGDLVLAISQSGETKDLVDILQEIAEKRPAVKRVSLVNNENSRIPQELSDFYLPILCGPETAVAATKSFVNQLVILYILAARACAASAGDASAGAASFGTPERELRSTVLSLKELLFRTLSANAGALDDVAKSLYLRSSVHLLGTGLIGLAKEGALKIREVVLNHAEGYDTAEFKHGPNTILGKNTVFSLAEIEATIDSMLKTAGTPEKADITGHELLKQRPDLIESLFSDYPLVFICPPDERDIRITISQIHTHKIRGANIILFAEKNADLELAVRGVPAGNERYRSSYIELPATGDRYLFVFAATVALQYLAFRMSELKMQYLDELKVADHGVHPDAPKNVSKSITVD